MPLLYGRKEREMRELRGVDNESPPLDSNRGCHTYTVRITHRIREPREEIISQLRHGTQPAAVICHKPKGQILILH